MHLMKKAGIMLMMLGVIMFAVGVCIIASFPFSEYPAVTSGSRWFLSGQMIIEYEAVQRMILWTLLTVFALVGIVFVGGIALIVTGYWLYNTKL